ncbi:MAG: 23S rRNA (uracil(1939)-C(5))-methyltransferase RlmD [Cyclobacteriaceae bacterium]
MKPKRIIENVELHGISADGRAVARVDNRVIFIRGGVPGDIADIQITGKEKKFLLGKIIKLITPSKDRIDSFCEHFDLCGGCKWQHMTYEAQLAHKQEHVISNLKKLSGLDLPESYDILGSKNTTYYRNKLEFTFSNNRWLTYEEIQSGEEFSRNALGFHIPKMFDKILTINHCHLQADPSNAIRVKLAEFAESESLTFYDIKKHQGLLRNLIVRNSTTGALMVIVQFAEDDQININKVLNHLKEEFPEITSLMYVINTKHNDTFYDLPVVNFDGEDFIEEKMDDLTFRIGPKSFYQTNSVQAHELYKIAAEFANIQNDEVVYDLYTGTGTIANFVARSAKKVVGIESVEDAVIDARKNSEINKISNTAFFAGDMKDLLSEEFIQEHGTPNVIITDPPRAGMHKNVIKQLNHVKAERIVYVSCNPATQARDLELLGELYEVKKIQPVDMFPHTHHVENIVLLVLKNYAERSRTRS